MPPIAYPLPPCLLPCVLPVIRRHSECKEKRYLQSNQDQHPSPLQSSIAGLRTHQLMYYNALVQVHDYISETHQTTQHHQLRRLTFSSQRKSELPQVGFEPVTVLSRPVLCPLSYRGSSVVVGPIRQYKAREVSLYHLITRGNSNLASTCVEIPLNWDCS